ncbi:terminal uridylyltransferase Tailor-like isoform X2 [Drosophila montana]|uniref:terminal uridylyltransferase Tailor-like isoform X2 n=1 Tax=Drosophila montana TaxID=40370 RepID=UPI00313D5480
MSLHRVTFWSELLEKVLIADDIKNKRDDAQLELETLLKSKLLSNSIGIYPFGSRIMGVGQETSDLDVYVELDNSFYEYSESPTMEVLKRQRILSNAFNSESSWKRIATYGGRCPIVTVKHTTGLQCDISCLNGLTYRQNKLVMYLFEIQPIARYMVIYLRGWIQSIGLQTSFRSHILILMVIFFLQLHNHLPGIDGLQKNLEPTVGLIRL